MPFQALALVSSPEPLDSLVSLYDRQACRPYVCVCVCVCVYVCVCVLSTFSNIFFSETAGLIEAKFHIKPPWDGGMKICSNGPGHMTKLAAMFIYGKKLK